MDTEVKTAVLTSMSEMLAKLADMNCVGVDEYCEESGIGKRAKSAMGQLVKL
jgi:hypothetical protein